MVLQISAWETRPSFPPYARAAMENGNLMEKGVIQQLTEEGWSVIRQQETVVVKGRKSGRLICRGMIDGFLIDAEESSKGVPFDAKDCSFGIFNRIQSAEDIQRDKWAWKWFAQAQLYMIALGCESFLIIMSHRGQRRYIPLELDLEAADFWLDLCELTMERVASLERVTTKDWLEEGDSILSDMGVPYTPQAERFCRDCDFYGTSCLPEIKTSTPEDALSRDDMADLVERHEALRESSQEFEKLDRVLKKELRGKHAVCGDYFVAGTWSQREYKAAEAKTVYAWRQDIRRIE